MLNLMRVELKKNRIRTYLYSIIPIFLVLFGLLYFLASHYTSYDFVFILHSMICMGIFMVFSSVMSTRFVVEEYAGKRAALILSYPVSRKHILRAKLVIVFLFVMISMMVCGLLSLGLFGISESVFPFIDETLSVGILFQNVRRLLTTAIIASSMGVVSSGIGFIRKSIPVTIVSSIIIFSAWVNVLVNNIERTLANEMLMSILAGMSAVTALVIGMIMFEKVNKMEVE